MMFEELLKTEPEHRIEQCMLISEYPCGCSTTITFAGMPQQFHKKDGKTLPVRNNAFWHNKGECTIHDEVDFSTVKKIARTVPLTNIVTEIKIANSVSVSKQIVDEGTGATPIR